MFSRLSLQYQARVHWPIMTPVDGNAAAGNAGCAENSPVVLFRCKANAGLAGKMVSQNVMQFNYTPEEFLSGKRTYSSIVHPQDLRRLTAETEEFAAAGEGWLLHQLSNRCQGWGCQLDYRWTSE